MEYTSISQMIKGLSMALGYNVRTKEVQQVLRQLKMLDRYNNLTLNAVGLYKMGYYRGRQYPKWNEEVEREIYEILLEKRNRGGF